MQNYKETEVVGTQWTRANAIIINNQYDSIPTITFKEEDIFAVGEHVVTRPAMHRLEPDLVESFSSPDTEFDLVHPLTGEVIGQSTYQDFQVILYSLYQHLATQRDARKEAIKNPPIPEIDETDPLPPEETNFEDPFGIEGSE